MAYEEISCTRCRQALSWYVAGQLSKEERLFTQQHLATCTDCSYELKLWHEIANVVVSERQSASVQPVIPYTSSWATFQARLGTNAEKGRSGHRLSVQHGLTAWYETPWDFIWPQIRLLRFEVWIMQVCIFILAAILLFSPLSWSDRIERMAYGTILLTALSAAFLPSPRREGIHVLMVTLPTSARSLFLLRLGIICCLAFVVNSIVLIPFIAGHALTSLSWLVSSWLAPLCCLVSITIFMTILLRSTMATLVILALWLMRGLSFFPQFSNSVLLRQYEVFWHQAVPLFLVALLTLGLAYGMANRGETYA